MIASKQPIALTRGGAGAGGAARARQAHRLARSAHANAQGLGRPQPQTTRLRTTPPPLLMIAAFLLCLPGLLCAQGLRPPRAVASVRPGPPERVGNYPHHVNHPTKRWLATLHNDPVSYGLQHWACYHESHAPQAIALEGQIGMTAPTSKNWYHNGFFNFALDGQLGRNYAVKGIRALDSGERASCEFVWELPQAWVRVRFMVIPGKQPLFCAITQLPKTDDVATLKVRLVCYPSGYFKSGKRVGMTAKQSVKTTSKADLDPQAEWSLILYDEKYDRGVEGGVGGCGGIAAPELVGESQVEIGSYACAWELEAKPGGKELRFAFWNGLDMKNAELVPALQAKFEPALADLKAIDFHPLRLQAGEITGLKAELEKLLAETKDSAAEEGAFGAALARLEELRPRIAAEQVDIEAEDEYLKTLDDLEALLWKLRMNWVFSE